MEYAERLGHATDPTDADPSVGLIECRSIARGFAVADAVVKQSPVDLLWCRTISPGHHVTLFAGEVAETAAALERGLEVAGDDVVDHMLIPNVHPDLAPAIRGARVVPIDEAVGIVECSHVATTIWAADRAAKTAHVDLLEVRLGMHLGGKGFFIVAGEVADVEEAVGAAADEARARDALVQQIVIPRASPELIAHLR